MTRLLTKKVVSYEETYNQIETFTSLDLDAKVFTASAQGEIAGIGGTVTSTTEARAHTEVKTNKYDRQKREVVLDTSARIFYPGPVYRDDYDDNGQLSGRTLVQEGEIWLVDRPIEVIHTVTPVEQEGTWDAALKLNLEDWAGNYGVHAGRRALERPGVRQPERAAVLYEQGPGAALQVAAQSQVERRIQARAGLAGRRSQSSRRPSLLESGQG